MNDSPRSFVAWLHDYLLAVAWAVLCITAAHATSAPDDKETHKPERFNRAAVIAPPPESEHYTVSRLNIADIGGA